MVGAEYGALQFQQPDQAVQFADRLVFGKFPEAVEQHSRRNHPQRRQQRGPHQVQRGGGGVGVFLRITLPPKPDQHHYRTGETGGFGAADLPHGLCGGLPLMDEVEHPLAAGLQPGVERVEF